MNAILVGPEEELFLEVYYYSENPPGTVVCRGRAGPLAGQPALHNIASTVIYIPRPPSVPAAFILDCHVRSQYMAYHFGLCIYCGVRVQTEMNVSVTFGGHGKGGGDTTAFLNPVSS